MIEIIKYKNRKLYVPKSEYTEPKYTSLKELSELVRSGESVNITCDVTGSNVTDKVLKMAIAKGHLSIADYVSRF